DGHLAATSTGALKFGSSDCDARFLSAVRQVAGNGARARAVLRQRHGGWFAVDFHGAPGEALAVVGLKEELAPGPQAMSAMAAAFQLTPSELDVLHQLLSGHCPKTAAIDLHISEHTVRAHLRSIYAKMNARGLNNTIRLACTFL
ncbi:MAG: LuxR family transcriptional regulator, partial [Oxalobacteraceae bacterium]